MSFWTNSTLPSSGLLKRNCSQPLDGFLLFVKNNILFPCLLEDDFFFLPYLGVAISSDTEGGGGGGAAARIAGCSGSAIM